MNRESYPPARAVAPKVQAHFARHHELARRRGHVPVAALPDAVVIESVINAAFWASLRREEGYVPKISMAYLAPDQDARPLLLEHPVPLSPSALSAEVPLASAQ